MRGRDKDSEKVGWRDIEKGEEKKQAEVYTEAEERMENIEVGKIKKKVEKKRAGFISTRQQLKAALISSPIDLVPYLHSFSAPGHEKKKEEEGYCQYTGGADHRCT